MSETSDCGGCGQDRRAFIEQLGLIAAAALVLPLRTIAAASVEAGEVRYALPTSDGAHIDREHQVILVRWQRAVYAFSLACPHQRTALRWRPDDARFQCPKHKSKYQPDGTFIEGRATRGMDRYAIARAGEHIVVNTATLFKQSDNPSGWQSAFIQLS